MRYHDTGSRDSAQTLASWLSEFLTEEVVELRVQTGYFSRDSLGILIPFLSRAAETDLVTKFVIGSNDAGTLRIDVEVLLKLLNLPRSNGSLVVASFNGGLFHPKTYHVRRDDESEAAFVGSANLTRPGLLQNIEAAISVDSRDGDNPRELRRIAEAIDSWFGPTVNGATPVFSTADLDMLVASKVLAIAPPPRPTTGGTPDSPSGTVGGRRLSPLGKIPPLPKGIVPTADEAESEEEVDEPLSGTIGAPVGPAARATTGPVVAAPRARLPSERRRGFPDYLLFDPAATGPTSGMSALSGNALPANVAGLIVMLNRDSARIFSDGPGTANISIPVQAISTIRFGIYGKHERPRAEFGLKVRYVTRSRIILGDEELESNIMGYGFTAAESGHGDTRMLLPAAIKRYAREWRALGLPVPDIDDLVSVVSLFDVPMFTYGDGWR